MTPDHCTDRARWNKRRGRKSNQSLPSLDCSVDFGGSISIPPVLHLSAGRWSEMVELVERVENYKDTTFKYHHPYLPHGSSNVEISEVRKEKDTREGSCSIDESDLFAFGYTSTDGENAIHLLLLLILTEEYYLLVYHISFRSVIYLYIIFGMICISGWWQWYLYISCPGQCIAFETVSIV